MPSHNIITLNSNPTEDLPARGHVDIYYNPVTGTIEAEDWAGDVVPFGTFGTSAPLENSLTYEGTDRALSANQGTLLEESKVDKVVGKGLSTNDFTDAAETKLTGLPTAAELDTAFGLKTDVSEFEILAENVSTLSGVVDTKADATAVNDAVTNLQNSKVSLAFHQTDAPATTITEITVTGLIAPADVLGNGTLIPAGVGVVNPVTNGRIGYTDNGDLDEAIFDRGVYFSAAFGTWRYAVTISGTTYEWEAVGVTDLTAENIAAWGWAPASGSEGLGIPAFEVTGSVTTEMEPGQMATSDERPHELVFRTANSQFASTPRLDSEGNLQVAGISPRAVSEDQWGIDIPANGELVVVGDTSCTCIGDGVGTVSELPWSGRVKVLVDAAWLTAHEEVPLGGGIYVDTVFPGASDIEFVIEENVGMILYVNTLAVEPNTRRRNIQVRVASGVTLTEEISITFPYGETTISGGSFNSGSYDPNFILGTTNGLLVFEVYLGNVSSDPEKHFTFVSVMAEGGTWQTPA